MENKVVYFTKSLMWSVKSDFTYVKWLVDTRDFQADSIPNAHARILYIAAAKSYARMAPQGAIPGIADVVLEIEKLSSPEIANGWASRIDQMEQPAISLQKDVANALAEEFDRRRVSSAIEDWLAGVKSGQVGGAISKSFVELSDTISGMLIGGESTGRPRDILEAARLQKLNTPESTGFPRLDVAIDGGWIPSKFYIIGMPSGHGKTSLCCNFASRRCEAGQPTIIHSMEMPARDLLFRMLCDLANVSLDVAENPGGRASSEDELDRVRFAEALLDAWVRVYDTPANAVEIERRIRRHKAEFGGVPILNEVDHLGIVRRSDREGRGEWAELESMAYSLVSLAQKNNVPLAAYSQVPFEVEQELLQNNMVVYNKDFRGSRGLRNAMDYGIMGCKHSGIVQDAETGTMVQDYSYLNHTVLQVTKNRRTGRQFWGVFRYEPVYFRLTNDRGQFTAGDRYD